MKRFRRSMQKMERQRMNNKGRCVAWWERGIAGGGIRTLTLPLHRNLDPKKIQIQISDRSATAQF